MADPITITRDRAAEVWREDYHAVYACPACQPTVTDDEAFALSPGMRFCPACGAPITWREAGEDDVPFDTDVYAVARESMWRQLPMAAKAILLVDAAPDGESAVILARGAAGAQVEVHRVRLWVQPGADAAGRTFTHIGADLTAPGPYWWKASHPAMVVRTQ